MEKMKMKISDFINTMVPKCIDKYYAVSLTDQDSNTGLCNRSHK